MHPKKKVPDTYPTPPAPVKRGSTTASPIHTPGISPDVGDGSTAYSAIAPHRLAEEAEEKAPTPSEFDDLEGRGYLRRDESSEEDGQPTMGPEVEMRSVAEIQADDARKARNRRLTVLQLERFRRAIAVNKAKHARRSSSTPWDAKARRGEGFDSVFAETPEGASPDSLRELRIVSYPWAHWVLGLLLVIAASVFVDHIHKKALAKRRLPIAQDTINWWKYLVAGIIYVCAAAVVTNGRVETFVMDKDTSLLTIRSTKPLCLVATLRRTRHVEKELLQILDVRVETSGEILSGEVDTRAYKVHFDFDDGTHATTLEGRSKQKAVVRCRLIKQFLLSCCPVQDNGSTTPPSPLSDSGSDAAVAPLGEANAITLPARSASSNLTLAVPAPRAMAIAEASPRRVMMVAAVPSSLSQQHQSAASTPK
jgi:hypothetical protein